MENEVNLQDIHAELEKGLFQLFAIEGELGEKNQQFLEMKVILEETQTALLESEEEATELLSKAQETLKLLRHIKNGEAKLKSFVLKNIHGRHLTEEEWQEKVDEMISQTEGLLHRAKESLEVIQEQKQAVSSQLKEVEEELEKFKELQELAESVKDKRSTVQELFFKTFGKKE